MKLNDKKREIILTKAEHTKAMQVGSDEYRALVKAKKNFPDYKVVTAKRKNSKQDYKHITKSFILGYIKARDNANYKEFENLFKLIGSPNYDDDNAKPITFFYIRKQFLNRYPQFMTEADRKKYDASLIAASATNTITMQPAASDPLSAKSA